MVEVTDTTTVKFKRALITVCLLLLIVVVTIIILGIILSKTPLPDDDEENDNHLKNKRFIITKCIFALGCIVTLLIVLIVTMLLGKYAKVKKTMDIKLPVQDWNQIGWGVFTKLITSVVVYSSLKIATFTMKSILRTQVDNEFNKSDNYKYIIWFILLWVICLLFCCFIAIFLYSVYLGKTKTGWKIPQYIQCSYDTFINHFSPNSIVLYIGFGLLLALNFLIMIYFVETKSNDSIVQDKANEKVNDDENDNEVEMDPNGIGFIYNLIDMIGQLDVVISILIIWIIDLLRL